MRELFGFLFYVFLFIGFHVCLFNFIELEAHKLFILFALCYIFLQLFQVGMSFSIGFETLLIVLSFLLVVGNDVNHIELEVFFLQKEVLMLAVNIYKHLA